MHFACRASFAALRLPLLRCPLPRCIASALVAVSMIAGCMAASLAAPVPAHAQTPAPRKVIVDQDAFEGPGLQPILMLIQDPAVEVVGITVVSGDGWVPEEMAMTLRMLELIGRTDIPVVAGAIHPLVNSKERNARREQMYGAKPYKGAWMDEWPAYNTMKRREPHAPHEVPPLPEGMPKTKPYPGSAAEFMLEMTRKYPGEVSIVAMGPVTNLALAQRLDDSFASRVDEVVLEGGSFFSPPIDDDHDEFTMQGVYAPRVSFNMYFDPEAAHIVFSSPWKKLTLVASDANEGIFGTQALLNKATASGKPVAEYVKTIAQPGFPLWDEVQAAAWAYPSIVTRKTRMAMDIDLMPGANYGGLLTWPEGGGPDLGEQDVEVVFRVDKDRMEKLFVDLLSR